jgi:regulator of sigma E protease
MTIISMLTILVFILILSILVLVHEAGHYFMARWAGMTVEEFGIGFPPKLIGKKDKRGTLWSINAIPLGGFVRIKGEGGDEKERFSPGAFATKSIPWRFGVLVGGVVMNMVAAWALFSLGFAIGLPSLLEGSPVDESLISERTISIVEVLKESPAEAAGMLPGDEVVAIDGEEFTSGEAAREALAPNEDGSPLVFTLERAGEEVTAEVNPAYIEELEKEGVGIALVETGIVRYPWYQAPLVGAQTTAGMTVAVVGGFWGLLTGIFSQEEVIAQLSGPVGIASLTGQVLDLGAIHMVQFAAMLSVNLAVLNILPFPALDGGRILFLFIEAVRRKPLTARFEQSVHGIGFALLLLLVLFVTYQDIVRLGS